MSSTKWKTISNLQSHFSSWLHSEHTWITKAKVNQLPNDDFSWTYDIECETLIFLNLHSFYYLITLFFESSSDTKTSKYHCLCKADFLNKILYRRRWCCYSITKRPKRARVDSLTAPLDPKFVWRRCQDQQLDTQNLVNLFLFYRSSLQTIWRYVTDGFAFNMKFLNVEWKKTVKSWRIIVALLLYIAQAQQMLFEIDAKSGKEN